MYSGSAGSVVGYMTKYLTKQDKDQKGEYQWRTRMSHKLGIDRLLPFLNQLQDQDLMTLSLFPSNLLPKSPIPLKLYQRIGRIILAKRAEGFGYGDGHSCSSKLLDALERHDPSENGPQSCEHWTFETTNTSFMDIYDKCSDHYLTCLKGSGILEFDSFDTSSSYRPRAAKGN